MAFPSNLPPFLLGAVAANLAWLTIWPIDVIKSQIQSGRFEGLSVCFYVNLKLKH